MKEPRLAKSRTFALRALPLSGVMGVMLAALGCNAILGLEPGERAGSAPDQTVGPTGMSSGDFVCEPSTVAACYDGPAETDGIGACRAGQKVCVGDGSGYGSCEGQALPSIERCDSDQIDEDCDGYQCSDLVWSKRFGDSAYQFTEALAVDAAGNVVVAGPFQGSIDLGGGVLVSSGAGDVFVAKFRPDGSHLWSKRFGDSGDQVATGVAIDPQGNIVVTGIFDSTIDFGGNTLKTAGAKDIFLAKLDPEGEHVWSQSFGDAQEQKSRALTADAEGNIVVVGQFMGTLSFGGGALTSTGDYDGFVVSFDPNGARRWNRSFGFGVGATQYCEGVAASADGDVVITGRFAGSVNFGEELHESQGSYDTYVAKFSKDGDFIWSRAYGGASEQVSRRVAVGPDGGAVVVGYFSESVDFGGGPLTSAGSTDIFVAKLDANGEHVFSRSYGDTDLQGVQNVSVDPQGDIFIVGDFSGRIDFGGGPLVSAGGDDMFVAKLSPAGDYVWAKSFGDVADQYAMAVATGASGSVFVGGYINGMVNMGGGDLSSQGAFDVFLARFEP